MAKSHHQKTAKEKVLNYTLHVRNLWLIELDFFILIV